MKINTHTHRNQPSPQPSLTLLKRVWERKNSSTVVEGSTLESSNLSPLTAKSRLFLVSLSTAISGRQKLSTPAELSTLKSSRARVQTAQCTVQTNCHVLMSQSQELICVFFLCFLIREKQCTVQRRNYSF